MVDLSLLDVAVLIAGAVATLLVVAPYLPVWFVFAILVGLAYYRLTRIVLDEATLERVVSVLLLSGLACLLWWRRLRSSGKQQ